MNSNVSSRSSSIEDELDIVEIISEIWKKKILVITVTLFFAVSSIYYSLTLSDVYKSSTLLKVHDTQSGSPLQSIGSFGSAFMDIGIDKTISKKDLAIALIESRDFFNFILNKYNLMPEIMAVESFDKNTSMIVYNNTLYNKDTDKWAEDQEVPTEQETYREYLSSIAVLQTESGFIELTYSHISPVFAKNLLDIVVSEINSLQSEKDKIETMKAIDYLNNQVKLTNMQEVKDTIYIILESQIEKLMTANIKSEYLVEVIDSSFIPEKKFKPSRALLVILATFFGLILSLLLIFFSKAGLRLKS
ncbi:Wzz/FepE/Etk N-terminal domain-containing protein [Gammaproteobacteria bacterium]|nr:Wzz/FepE/Etk N-terminal domain-containing protein [Gammaproteobacteria bacterium]